MINAELLIKTSSLKDFLDRKADQYNRPSFIERDPISIPHRFSRKQDIELMGFWAAVLAWGQRPVILKKANELVSLMDGAPYDFVRNHEESDLQRFLNFKHRTFNASDALYFLHFFRQYYLTNESLEDAFLPKKELIDSARLASDPAYVVEQGLIAFHDRFCSLTDFFPERTRKHIATPARNSSCKRLLMFLRWMVRQDDRGVDFGIWTRLRPSQLVMPIDVHVNRVSRELGLLTSRNAVPTQPDWKAALALTEVLRAFDPADPVRYDFALFGLGVDGEM
ncbi:TIGR02757 family protein [Spirosoma validum]|uniref:TIGR02757 family protein n=1 Tax=Spirosoma validum TaxID=2771355 RepID=A0A927AZL0_9BACT|nr:TIGR02757 family protein [Spirosoma validum]MBD2752684.1 TIGR02757 family protein [Spirosoma validum]